MDKNVTEEQANEGLQMLVGDTRQPLSEFWRHFNAEKEKEWKRVERRLLRLSFEKKMRLLEGINNLIDEAIKPRKKKENKEDEGTNRLSARPEL